MTPPEHLWLLVLWLCIAVGLMVPVRDRVVAATAWLCAGGAVWSRRWPVVMAVWFLVVLGLSLQGVLALRKESLNPLLPVTILLPLIAGAFWLWVSHRAAVLLNVISVAVLIGMQVYRGIGGVFLLLLDQGVLPAEFARPAAYGDMLVGAGAATGALLFGRTPRLACSCGALECNRNHRHAAGSDAGLSHCAQSCSTARAWSSPTSG